MGVGSDTVDVEVRPVKTMRSFAVEAKPSTVHRGYQTDKGYQKDVGVGTVREPQAHKGVSTTPVTTFPAATNTEEVKLSNAGVETELKIFQVSWVGVGGWAWVKCALVSWVCVSWVRYFGQW